MGLVGIDVQMSHLHLGPGPRQARLAFKDVHIAIFFGQRDRVLVRLGHPGSEDDLRSFVRLQPDPATQTENRIQNGADRVRQWAIFHDRHRVGGGMSPAQKP